MKALMVTSPAPRSLALVEVPAPEHREDHLLVRVLAAGICGTDLHIYDWNERAARTYRPPFILGHEFTGEVVWAPSGQSDWKVGDVVTVESHIACGKCYQCQRGQGHICRRAGNFSQMGYSGMADYTLMPLASVRPMPPGVDPEVGVLIGPLGVSVHALEVVRPAGYYVGITGCGPVGLFAIAVAKAMGARRVIATEPVAYRRQLALDLGADLVLDPQEVSVSQAFVESTGGRGVDILVEASGNGDALLEALKGVRWGGDVCLVGSIPKPVTIDLAPMIIHRGITVHGVVARLIDSTWHMMDGLLASGALDIAKVITHRFPLAQFRAGFEAASRGEAGKVLLIP